MKLFLIICCLFVFSTCGGIRTDSKMPVLTAYVPLLAYGILGKSGLFVAPPLEECLTGLMGSSGSSTRAGTCSTNLQLIGSSVADCQALTILMMSKGNLSVFCKAKWIFCHLCHSLFPPERNCTFLYELELLQIIIAAKPFIYKVRCFSKHRSRFVSSQSSIVLGCVGEKFRN